MIPGAIKAILIKEDGFNTLKTMSAAKDPHQTFIIRLESGLAVGMRSVDASVILLFFSVMDAAHLQKLMSLPLLAILEVYSKACEAGLMDPIIKAGEALFKEKTMGKNFDSTETPGKKATWH